MKLRTFLSALWWPDTPLEQKIHKTYGFLDLSSSSISIDWISPLLSFSVWKQVVVEIIR